MIMGLGSNQSGWIYQTRFFKNNYRVITFDNRGSGKSDKPEGPYSIRMMADDTLHLMDYLDITKAHVLGLSMGGMIAQELAINYPQRVMKLVLGCTFTCHDDALNGFTAEFVKALDLYIEGKVSPLASLLFNSRINRIMTGLLMKIQRKLMQPSDLRGFLAQGEACARHHTADRLPLITAKTLVIVGTGDRVIKPSSSEEIAKLIPNAKLVKIENGSHGFPGEMSNRFNREVLDFLTGS